MTTELTRRGNGTTDPGEGKRTRAGGDQQRTVKPKQKPVGSRTSAPSVRQEPRVDLLPPEVKASRRNDAIARRLVLGLVIVILLVAGGIGGSTVLAMQANAALASAQQQTVTLAQQQQKYAEVRTVQKQIALTQAGQQVGASTEVDWTAFLDKVKTTVAANGLSLTGITIDSASPLAAYQQSTVPLQGTRVATVTVDVRATNLDQVSAWLAQLGSITSVADVSPGTITLDESGYSASAIMHLNESAFDGRFAAKGK